MSASPQRQQLVDMGFEPARIDWAMHEVGPDDVQRITEHIINHQEKPVPDYQSKQATTTSATTTTGANRPSVDEEYDAEDQAALADMFAKRGQGAQDTMLADAAASAKSIKCVDCGKLLKSVDFANYHAEKSGHTNFEESTEEIKPLTEEERKQRLDEMRAKLAAKRQVQAKKDAEEAKQNEKIRRKAGQDMSLVRDELQKKGMTLASGFTLPPMHNFPPFFTPQPNPTTWATQSAMWSRLILDWARFHRRFHLDADGEWERGGADGLLYNAAIQRRLDADALRRVLEVMVQAGDAGWDPQPGGGGGGRGGARGTGGAPAPPPPPSRALLYWRRPAEWGQLIHDWVNETGQSGSILTLYELQQGDAARGTEFESLPIELLRRALRSLVAAGKAQLFEGTAEAGEGEGVKFV